MTHEQLKLRLLHALGSGGVVAGLMGGVACSGEDVVLPSDERGNSAGGTGDQPAGGTAGETVGIAGAPAGGSGGSDLPANCSRTSIGVCCAEPKCMTPEEAWALARGANVSEGDSGASPTEAPVHAARACPSGAELPSGVCSWYGGGSFEAGECCYAHTTGTCCGRPFIVEGRQRDAGSQRRDDWLAAVLAPALELDSATRAALTAAWLSDARLEHASVASFSRFLLHLLGLGAPAALVERAQAAISDEIRHARLCFALASRYAEQPLGPGQLDLTGSAEVRSLADAAADAVLEGCVGETLAALDASDRLALSSDPDVRAALELISVDEAAHAELAWSFVRWAIAEGGAPVRRSVAAAFEHARAKLGAGTAEGLGNIDVDAWHAHGRLTADESVARQRAAFREVIVPCSRALLGESELQLLPSLTA